MLACNTYGHVTKDNLRSLRSVSYFSTVSFCPSRYGYDSKNETGNKHDNIRDNNKLVYGLSLKTVQPQTVHVSSCNLHFHPMYTLLDRLFKSGLVFIDSSPEGTDRILTRREALFYFLLRIDLCCSSCHLWFSMRPTLRIK